MTHVKVEAMVSPSTKREIIDYLANGAPSLEAVKYFDNSPKIVKVITYSASEHITLLESPPSSAPSKDYAHGKECAADLLVKMIENGPREFEFNRRQLQRVLRMAADIFLEECSLLEVCFPDNIFVIRGNHEEESLNQLYSFATEVHSKFDAKSNDAKTAMDPMYDHFKNVFMNLPLACLIGRDILAMHGGISPKLKSLQDIREIARPIDEFMKGTLACDLVWSDPDTLNKDIREIARPIDEFMKGTLACDLVWSDPDTLNKVVEFEPNLEREATVGIGQLFSQSAVKDACRRLKVKMIIRGHQAPLHGYARWANGLLITLFSAPAYKGSTEDTVNLGACIEVPVSGDLVVKQLSVDCTDRTFREKS
ncbi:hypothetical protein TELCIR_02488 [Teladorsagia circumcincta]|uniref:Serine/threonine-protein phosphatase n=1 Tax=Teladorsagia circumcincta TaxID=45464 RepID=A0A2G9UZ09_TELCI|nr:hypothetical protein TELCIR_02488 [Teladorsagia circumcincta]